MMINQIPKDLKLSRMKSPGDKEKALGQVTKSDPLIIYFFIFIIGFA